MFHTKLLELNEIKILILAYNMWVNHVNNKNLMSQQKDDAQDEIQARFL